MKVAFLGGRAETVQFGDVIKQLRNEKKITQQELADAIGVSKSSISMYEINRRMPEIDTFESLADYFNVDKGYSSTFNFLCADFNPPTTLSITIFKSVPLKTW